LSSSFLIGIVQTSSKVYEGRRNRRLGSYCRFAVLIWSKTIKIWCQLSPNSWYLQ